MYAIARRQRGSSRRSTVVVVSRSTGTPLLSTDVRPTGQSPTCHGCRPAGPSSMRLREAPPAGRDPRRFERNGSIGWPPVEGVHASGRKGATFTQVMAKVKARAAGSTAKRGSPGGKKGGQDEVAREAGREITLAGDGWTFGAVCRRLAIVLGAGLLNVHHDLERIPIVRTDEEILGTADGQRPEQDGLVGQALIEGRLCGRGLLAAGRHDGRGMAGRTLEGREIRGAAEDIEKGQQSQSHSVRPQRNRHLFRDRVRHLDSIRTVRGVSNSLSKSGQSARPRIPNPRGNIAFLRTAGGLPA
ncbi:hypothetical protein OJF2_72780 [Aquisphaera giovannonii]|uniref:Uncharacterized protein n=1 Tax=Aquisphaera giovannonii TaxID=406548 RepID=A0A5B9WDM5_9BACT|nr:hypothetical protein OJF2_72780 [Aquisphaera giovannonii]